MCDWNRSHSHSTHHLFHLAHIEEIFTDSTASSYSPHTTKCLGLSIWVKLITLNISNNIPSMPRCKSPSIKINCCFYNRHSPYYEHMKTYEVSCQSSKTQFTRRSFSQRSKFTLCVIFGSFFRPVF